MRDLINLIENIITEANLGATEIPATKLSAVANPKNGKPFTRPELFLYKVKTGSPFTLVTISPWEGQTFAGSNRAIFSIEER